MDGVYNINSKVAKLSREHVLINQYVSEFNKNFKTKDREFFKGIETFFVFLEKELLNHFRFEEVVIFPASLVGESTYGNVLMVMTLQKEHGILETQLEALKSEIRNLRENKAPLTDEPIDKIKLFFDSLKNHAKREMTDLYPMIDANSKCKALLEIYAKEMTDGSDAMNRF